ncbi:galactosyl transferase GMA12/MNN10 family-domain-containing protein [Aspergillus desertorum]
MEHSYSLQSHLFDHFGAIVYRDVNQYNPLNITHRQPSQRLLDAWWDPVMYEQRHMRWEHKEQDALEYLYVNQPWVRSHVAFVPQRYFNSFPPGACGEALDPKVHYTPDGRDFVVNMAGCDFGRDCRDEMYRYREYSKWLNRPL